MAAIRVDKVMDLRETVSYRVSFHDYNVSETINCSTLVGNSASLGTPRMELLSIKSNVDKHFSVFNLTPGNTESLAFSTGSGHTDLSFAGGIADQSTRHSSVVKIESHANTSGYALLTFVKKAGFENIGRGRRKPQRPNPYS